MVEIIPEIFINITVAASTIVDSASLPAPIISLSHTPSVITNTSSSVSPIVLVSSSPGTNAIGKQREPASTTTYTNFLPGGPVSSTDSFIQLEQIENSAVLPVVSVITGGGIRVFAFTISNTAVIPGVTLTIRFNPSVISPSSNIEETRILSRGEGEIDRNMRSDIEANPSQDLVNSLSVLNTAGGSLDNVPIHQKSTVRNVTDSSKSKDRRIVLSSIVNHYNRAGNR